jgi:hypothetical protein
MYELVTQCFARIKKKHVQAWLSVIQKGYDFVLKNPHEVISSCCFIGFVCLLCLFIYRIFFLFVWFFFFFLSCLVLFKRIMILYWKIHPKSFLFLLFIGFVYFCCLLFVLFCCYSFFFFFVSGCLLFTKDYDFVLKNSHELMSFCCLFVFFVVIICCWFAIVI